MLLKIVVADRDNHIMAFRSKFDRAFQKEIVQEFIITLNNAGNYLLNKISFVKDCKMRH